MPIKPCHFYVAFNPLFNGASSYKTQAHEFYYELKKKVLQNPGSHMYWGKLKVSEYSEPLLCTNFQKVLKDNSATGSETHLYISDYQHLWVAKVTEILAEVSDKENTLDFYQGKNVEVWFKIIDFDLISQNTEITTQLLTNLFVDNEFYNFKMKEVTPFSSGLRFPMIIQDRRDERFFEGADSQRIKRENRYIETPEIDLGIKKTQSYVIPEKTFNKLPAMVRDKLLSAEILLVEATAGGQKNRMKLELAILNHLRCLEILLNDTFISHLRKEQGHRIFVTHTRPSRFMRVALENEKNGMDMLMHATEPFELGQIKMLMDTPTFFPHTTLDWTFRDKKKFWEYCRLELRQILKNESLIELRNNLMSGNKVLATDRELLFIRNILLGIGDVGVYQDIVENFYNCDKANISAA